MDNEILNNTRNSITKGIFKEALERNPDGIYENMLEIIHETIKI